MGGRGIAGALGAGAVALAVAAAIASCRGADAAPEQRGGELPRPRFASSFPAEWRELPEVAAKAMAAMTTTDVEATAIAHGDPHWGCYLVALQLHGSRPDTAARIVERLGKQLGGDAVLHSWRPLLATGALPAQLGGEITVGGVRGELLGWVALDPSRRPRVTLAACVHGPRDPATCQADCARLLPTLAPPES